MPAWPIGSEWLLLVLARSQPGLPLLFVASLSFSVGMADAGPVWEGGLTLVHQDSDDNRVSSETTLSGDLTATWELDRGTWFLYVEGSTSTQSDGISAFYPTANADAGSVLAQDGTGGVQISELNYAFNLSADRTLMLGLVDPSAWLDRGRIANDENQHFINGSFVNNATIEFPDYTVGGVFRSLGNGSRPEITVILAGSEGIADLPDRSYQDLLDVTSDERGVFLGAGASWLRDEWSWRIGTWIRSDDHEVAGNATGSEENFGAYVVMGWRQGAHAINARLGAANSNVAIADRFMAIAYERETSLGLLGLGIARTEIADGFRIPGRDHAYDAELFFRIPILDAAGHVTPSIQVIRNPGFDASNEVTRASAVIFGARVHWGF